MRIFSIFLLFLISSSAFAQKAALAGIDPDLIDPEMTQVMYLINPKDFKTNTYHNSFPSSFKIKLCQACQIKSYSLIEGAELLLNEKSLALKDLTVALIKNKFDVIQLGIDRSNKTVTYLYLGGISELNDKDRAQELSNEY